MKIAISVLLIVIVSSTVAFGQGLPAEKNAEQIAIESTETWLKLVDEGKYSESWNEAAQYFKNAVSKEQWEQSLTAIRTPLAEILSRKLETAQYFTTLPGAPDGEYVVIQYETSFKNKKSAMETVTPMLDKDGKWRVSGYYIK
ncbi:MAG: DUF4019 domain-containing protein [Candidatus Omnitrophota bacterium]